MNRENCYRQLKHKLTNKSDQLKEIVLKYIDILVTAGAKLDDTLPNTQFFVSGFSKPFLHDMNGRGWPSCDLRSYIPRRLLTKYVLPIDVACIF